MPVPRILKIHLKQAFPGKTLTRLHEQITTLPDDLGFISKTIKLVEERAKMVGENRIDWALGELFAYGSLLLEGHPVRISGQDSIRGTFSHRHAGIVMEETTEIYFPLKYIDTKNRHPSTYTIHR